MSSMLILCCFLLMENDVKCVGNDMLIFLCAIFSFKLKADFVRIFKCSFDSLEILQTLD